LVRVNDNIVSINKIAQPESFKKLQCGPRISLGEYLPLKCKEEEVKAEWQ
jgi:hypothetical protein